MEGHKYSIHIQRASEGFRASQVAQWSRICLLIQETQETWVQSLGWEDPLKKEMATHSSFLAWETPWTEEPGRLQSTGLQRIGHNLGNNDSEGFIGQVTFKWDLKNQQASAKEEERVFQAEGTKLHTTYVGRMVSNLLALR